MQFILSATWTPPVKIRINTQMHITTEKWQHVKNNVAWTTGEHSCMKGALILSVIHSQCCVITWPSLVFSLCASRESHGSTKDEHTAAHGRNLYSFLVVKRDAVRNVRWPRRKSHRHHSHVRGQTRVTCAAHTCFLYHHISNFISSFLTWNAAKTKQRRGEADWLIASY